MHFFATFACVAVASGAVARKIQPIGWDKYAEERGFPGHDDPMEHASVHAREADPEATQAWEHAHGGKAPTYKGYGESEHGHFVARSESYEIEHDPHGHEESRDHFFERDVPDFGEEEVDTSLEGYGEESELHTRSIPVFDDEEVDTSLEGYGDEFELNARSIPDFDEDDVDVSLEGYTLHARSEPEFDEEDVDTSLEGYGESELDARSEEEWEEEATKSLHHSATGSYHGHEDSRTAWSEHSAWTKPTHVARAIKSAWDHYSGKGAESDEEPKHHHYARNAKGKLVYSAEPMSEENHKSEHGGRHYARDAEAAYAHGFREGMQHSDAPVHRQHAREAEARVPAGYGINEYINAYRPVEARNAEAHVPAGYGAKENVNGFHRPHQARDAEPASAHHSAHPTASRTAWSEEDESWTKHTAAKTASPSKTGGWGLPW
ncbi:hypothetical protein LTR36_007037 [Oleoguttula mirabilis]|uniref:Uncharacterized protein n=1 Tax=Oleoguttula mirabilis TaxID=1507867 RepID=A0AAV9JAM8_9PEZI|nr:hypothetical protein LTR36_007037 [Oleoguttula mirabilis]